jgi:hypothetical protein
LTDGNKLAALLSAGSVPGELAARVAAGPAFWAGWVDDLDRGGLLEELLGRDAIERALKEAPGSGRYEPALNAKMTLVCVLAACLFPDEGYAQVLARAFGIPGLRFWPGPVPAASALSQARERPGGHAVRRLFEIDAEAGDADLGLTVPWHGLEVTAIDGTTLELDRSEALACESGSSPDAGRPLLRIVGHVRVASRRWIAAETGTCHQGENELADGLLWSLRGGMVNLADRGFPSMERYLAAAAGTGADLVWRWKNGKDCLPARTLEVLPGGSELVVMRESRGMLARRRRASRDHAARRLPDTIARLVTFTILTRTLSGRRKTTRVRVLTTLLDHEEFPAREIAMLHARRWQIEIAFLHLKATVRGGRRELRGQFPALARQEARGLLLIHNLVATAAARAAVQAGTSPKLIPFAPALALIRDRVTADACCPHCERRQFSAEAQVKALINDIAGLPRHRAGRQRTSPRTAAERRDGHTENVSYTITIEKSNLPEWDVTPNT